MQIRRLEEHNESPLQWKRRVKEEQNRNIPHLSFSKKKTTQKTHRKIKPCSWNILLIYFTQSQTTALNENKTHSFIKERSNSIRSPSNNFSSPYIYIYIYIYISGIGSIPSDLGHTECTGRNMLYFTRTFFSLT